MREKLVKFIKIWFPVIVYSGIIFYVSSLPGKAHIRFDKLVHLAVYIPFGFLAAWALTGTNGHVNAKTLMLLIVLISALYGISDEFHQSFVPGRDADWADVVADTVGGTIGGLLFVAVTRRERRTDNHAKH